MSRLRVLFITSSYPADARDWRSRFISDQLGALARETALDIRYWGPPGLLPPGVLDITGEAEREWLRRLMVEGGLAHVLRNRPLHALGTVRHYLRLLRRAAGRHSRDIDVAHINWLQNALPLTQLTAPALVTVLGSDFGLLRLPGMKTLVRRALCRGPRCLAPNAAWMTPTLKTAFGDHVRVRAVPFGVDERWYSVTRVPRGGGPPRWLVVTRLTRAKLGPLFEWAEPLFRQARELHIFGPNPEDVVIPSWVNYHGPTYPEALAGEWFPSAAGLISLSRHNEGRPQVMIEAMAAGLPVIASRLPAHADLIRDGETGMLVDSPAAFAAALERLDSPEFSQVLGKRARDWTVRHIGTWSDAAARYVDLYHNLMEGRLV